MRQGSISSSDLTSASLTPQSPVTSILVTGAAIALLLVEIDQAIDHGVARQHLQLGIERGAHREPALVELVLSVIVVEIAPHLFGEIFGGKDVGAGGRTVTSSGSFFAWSPSAAEMKPSSTMRSMT